MRLTKALNFALLATLLSPLASAEVIISNFSAPASGGGTVIGSGTSTQYKAFGFTMGSQGRGLEDVVLTMDFANAGATPIVSIWSDGGGVPGSELIALVTPPGLSGAGDYTFTPASPFTFQANTTYWVHVRSEPLTNPQFRWNSTTPNTMPAGTATPIGYIFNGSSSSTYNRLQVNSDPAVGTQYCPGDGIVPHTGCPCGNNNNGDLGGCDWGNPAFPGGGLLSAEGSASMGANDTLLLATGIENNFGVFFGANTQVNGGNGNILNDGLRCAGGGLVRLTPPTAATGNQATLPASVQTLDTGAAAGVTRRYQYWFRTPGGPCGTSANLTNGLEIAWGS